VKITYNDRKYCVVYIYHGIYNPFEDLTPAQLSLMSINLTDMRLPERIQTKVSFYLNLSQNDTNSPEFDAHEVGIIKRAFAAFNGENSARSTSEKLLLENQKNMRDISGWVNEYEIKKIILKDVEQTLRFLKINLTKNRTYMDNKKINNFEIFIEKSNQSAITNRIEALIDSHIVSPMDAMFGRFYNVIDSINNSVTMIQMPMSKLKDLKNEDRDTYRGAYNEIINKTKSYILERLGHNATDQYAKIAGQDGETMKMEKYLNGILGRMRKDIAKPVERNSEIQTLKKDIPKIMTDIDNSSEEEEYSLSEKPIDNLLPSSQKSLNIVADIKKTLQDMLGFGVALKSAYTEFMALGPHDIQEINLKIYQEIHGTNILGKILQKKRFTKSMQ
jgi:hypothetical protein